MLPPRLDALIPACVFGGMLGFQSDEFVSEPSLWLTAASGAGEDIRL